MSDDEDETLQLTLEEYAAECERLSKKLDEIETAEEALWKELGMKDD